MRQPLRRRLSLSILFLKLCLFSSYSFKRIPSSSLMTFFFLSTFLTRLPLCPSQSLSQLPLPSFSSFLFIAVPAASNQQLRCHSTASATLSPMLSPSLGWTAGGVGGGAATWGNLGHPKDSSASKPFWIYELLPTLWNFSAQFQMEMVELSFFHQVLHIRCETFAMASHIFLSSLTTT